MRILFVGADWYGSNATSLRNGFIRAGHEVVTIDTSVYSHPKRYSPVRVAKRLGGATWFDLSRSHLAKRLEMTGRDFDASIVFKGNLLARDMVESLPGFRVHYHPDDALNMENVSQEYLDAESAYHLLVTTKSFNVVELQSRSGVMTRFLWCAYDDVWHRPADTCADAWGFIGTCRPGRIDRVLRLAALSHNPVHVSGTGWPRARLARNGVRAYGPQYGQNYSALVGVSSWQLGLLNYANRDLHTCRSFEVPAAGGLIIAPRTAEHAYLFTDRRSAFLFDSEDEWWDVVNWIESNPEKANEVRLRGMRDLRTEANTYVARAAQIVDWVASC